MTNPGIVITEGVQVFGCTKIGRGTWVIHQHMFYEQEEYCTLLNFQCQKQDVKKLQQEKMEDSKDSKDHLLCDDISYIIELLNWFLLRATL